MAKCILLAILSFAILFLAGCAKTNGSTQVPAQLNGTLTGKVTVGPLCPVEPCQVTPKQMMEAYNSRKVFAYSKDNGIKVAEYQLNYSTDSGEGAYRLFLAPEAYTVWVSGADGVDPSLFMLASNFGTGGPKDVKIYSNSTSVLDFDIDTGIR